MPIQNSKSEIPNPKVLLEQRTKAFALRIIHLVSELPRNKVSDVLGYQLLKAGTSIGANYREANRAESRDDFIHKIAIVEKEASETQYWLELIEESDLGEPNERLRLLKECGELVAIFTTVGKTAKSRRNVGLRNAKCEFVNTKSEIPNLKFELRNSNPPIPNSKSEIPNSK